MNDTKYTPVLVSYSLGNSKQPGFCQNSQVPRPLRITRLSEPFLGFPNNVQRGKTCQVFPVPKPKHEPTKKKCPMRNENIISPQETRRYQQSWNNFDTGRAV